MSASRTPFGLGEPTDVPGDVSELPTATTTRRSSFDIFTSRLAPFQSIGSAFHTVGSTMGDVLDTALNSNRRRFSTYVSIGEGTPSTDTDNDSRNVDDNDDVQDRNFTPLSGAFKWIRSLLLVQWLIKSSMGKWFIKNILGEEEYERNIHYNRIVDRNGKFFQSNGRMAIKKKIRSEDWHALYAGDLFHALVDAPTARTLLILLSSYFFLVVAFSIPYYLISKIYGCDMGIDTYQEAFAFSLETMATIGYGTQDIYFNNCWAPLFTLGSQISCKLIAEAVIIGVIYCRFGRPSKRASTIILSNKAILRRISGKLYFMFQLVELRKHQLVEAQVRLYTIRRDIAAPTEEECDEQGIIGESKEEEKKSNSSTTFQGGGTTGFPVGSVTHFQTCKMRLSFPNDALGGLLIMCLPQVIVHEVDAWSPLMPPPIWRSITDGKIHQWAPPVLAEFTKTAEQYEPNMSTISVKSTNSVGGGESVHSRAIRALSFPNVVGRSESATAAATATTTTPGNLYNGEDEEFDDGMDEFQSPKPKEIKKDSRSNSKFPPSPGPQARTTINPATTNAAAAVAAAQDAEMAKFQVEKDMIQLFMIDRKMEIFAIVEGIDATTGGPCQARHSFIPSEIEWDKSFAPCVFEDERDGSAVIDFSVFHDLVDVPSNATSCGHTSSYT